MFQRILVAVDESEPSWRAVEVGELLATRTGSAVELVHVVGRPDEIPGAERRISAAIAARGHIINPPPLTLAVADLTIPAALAHHVADVSDTLVVMASHGRGRSGAIFGSVATDLVDTTHGPIVMVGPHVDVDRLAAATAVVIPADGSAFSEAALSVAGALSVALDLQPWVVGVRDPNAVIPDDVGTSAYPAHLAHHLAEHIGRDVEFEALSSHHVGAEIARFALEVNAMLVVASTHGRTGAGRLAHGSVTSDVVRHATCPVVLIQPTDLPERAPGTEARARAPTFDRLTVSLLALRVAGVHRDERP